MIREDEKKLVDAFLLGDRAAYKTINAWISDVLRLRSWNAVIRSSADDICQDVVIALMDNFRNDKYRGEGLKTYVSTVTKYKCLNVYDRRIQTDPVDDNIGSNEPNPEQELVNSERYSIIREVLEKLEYRCRRVLALRYYRDLGHEDIAKRLKINVATARQWLKRCLDKAREYREELENSSQNRHSGDCSLEED